MAEGHKLLKAAYRHDGKSCREVISDAQRMLEIREKKEEGERLISEAESMRKRGLALLKEAEAEEKREKIIQSAIQAFVLSDQEFIADNGSCSDVMRLREGEKNGRTYVVIKGSNSPKEFPVFFRV
ncbi:MAG: hypothetical protein HQL08_13950 [Nitrospirae bacterium]|nr:hypothetical protein [Nitrospirota bacterium]